MTEEIKETVTTENKKETKKTTTKRKTTKKETKSKATVNKELRKYAKDIDVEVQSLVAGELFYVSNKTNEILELEETGDTDVVSLELLIEMSKKSKTLLKGLYLVILDVYNNEEKGEFTVDDVLSFLGIEDSYVLKENNLEYIDKLIIDTTYDEFEKEFNKIKIEEVKERIIERSVALFKEGKLDSDSKKNLLSNYSKNPYLFKLI